VTPFQGAGFQFHCIWQPNYDDPKRDRVLSRMVAAGFRWARIDISWKELQPTSATAYNTGYRDVLDKCVSKTVNAGLTPFIGVLGTPQWASGSSDWKTAPTNPDPDFKNFMQTMAARYPSVAAWQIYNEPNQNTFWLGTIQQYVATLKAGYAGVKAGNPSAKVITGGTTFNDYDWVRSLYDNGGKGWFDGVGVHPYPAKADEPPEYVPGPERYWFPNLSKVRDVMVEKGDSAKTIWITEFGYSAHENHLLPSDSSDYWWARGVTETVQADFAIRAFEYARKNWASFVPVFIWYKELSWPLGSLSPNWFDLHTQNYGLLRDNETPRPVYCSIKAYLTGAGC
jgi:polysaccharide biosynthesis protein PslG